ncbi:MAG: hypothetical protein ACK56I_23205, partial [bacterium]
VADPGCRHGRPLEESRESGGQFCGRLAGSSFVAGRIFEGGDRTPGGGQIVERWLERRQRATRP